jgi:DNA-binding LacI/PurR family transcriptional regulator
MEDVARAAGVSRALVSLVMRDSPKVSLERRQRVLDAAAELGYVVNAMARGMVARRTYTLGVFVRDASTPFYGHLLTAMQERASHHGYRVVTTTGSGRFEIADERRALETLVMLQVEGLVVCSGLLPAEDIAAFVNRIPTVVAGRPERHPGITSVYCDEEHGGAGLADHVVELGHRTVAVITLGVEQSLTMSARTAAMVRRLRQRGVDVLELAGGPASGVGALVPAIAARPDVTAVMAPSDWYAVRVLEALAEAGIDVPGRLSVTGYDAIGYNTSLIGLTTWRQPLGSIGARAVDAVVGLLDADSPPSHQALHGELVPGRTAAPPSQGPS